MEDPAAAPRLKALPPPPESRAGHDATCPIPIPRDLFRPTNLILS
jgi:hypothetical protein